MGLLRWLDNELLALLDGEAMTCWVYQLVHLTDEYARVGACLRKALGWCISKMNRQQVGVSGM